MSEVKDDRTFGFTQVSNSLFKEDAESNGITKPSEIAVYVVLTSYAGNKTKKAWPGIKTIAKQARVSERTVRYCVKQLEKSGYITIESRYNEKGQTSNLYTIIDR